VAGERFAVPDACMHALVAAHAARRPDAPAVAHGAITLSYGALDARANQLAHHLRGLGVGRDVRVALCFERSADAIVAQLGVLKAGGAYVPLDPGNPTARLAFVIGDSGARVTVADPRLVARLPDAGVITLDATAGEPTTAPVTDVRPDDVAYVIYTSGSTGTPKGVLIEHRGLVNHAVWKANTYDVSRTSQFASLAFDASVGEIWSPLSAGGCVVIVDDALRTDPAALIAWLAAQRITSADLPTAVGELVISSPWPPLANQLHLWLGGDRLRRRPPADAPYVVVNTYGPTECTVEATTAVIRAGDGLPPIGRPVGNLTACVLDAHRQPVPVGAAGELYIGGAGVARGYLDRPELTAARFVTSPAGDRLYRTGDRCRWRDDGELEFLGRVDHQVKLRGFRIELGEIEHALTTHPAVRDAAVIVRGDRLVAYVVAAGEPTAEPACDLAALRAHLAASLPEYMLPSLVVWLAALPMTRNGKLDRAALPEPAAPPVSSHAFTELERQLNAVWADVLGAPSPDPDASFFAAGGHSLSAVMLVHRVSAAFARRITLASFFQRPTLAGLAELVAGDRAWSPVIALERRGAGTPVFCVHPSLGSVASYEALARALGADRPIYALTPIGLALDQTPDPRVEAMAARYLAAIRDVQPHGPYLLAGHSFGGLVAFELAHQLQRAGERVAGLALLDTAAPGPLWHDAAHDAHDIVAALAELGVTVEPAAFAGLDLDAQIERCFAAIVAAGGAAFDHAQLRRMIAWHARVVPDAYRAYAPAPYAGATVLLRARELRGLAVDALFTGWSALAPRLVEQRVPGDHYSMLRPPHLDTLAAQLRHHLAAFVADQ
jgi:amino acid adenylation domain-containing protein